MKKTRILVVEDDFKLQSLLGKELGLRDFEIVCVDSEWDALFAMSDDGFDLLLVDITLRDGSGLDLCRAVRVRSSVPILFLSATDDPKVKMAALQMGGDDYITKPFHLGELLARMNAVLRRARASDTDLPLEPVITIGDLTVDLERRMVSRGGAPIPLTKTEFGLLAELVTHRDRVLTYDHLFWAVWGERIADHRSVHFHISNLRRKIEPPSSPRRLVSVPGVGYRFRQNDNS